jgi:hypothetical protein
MTRDFHKGAAQRTGRVFSWQIVHRAAVAMGAKKGAKKVKLAGIEPAALGFGIQCSTTELKLLVTELRFSFDSKARRDLTTKSSSRWIRTNDL